MHPWKPGIGKWGAVWEREYPAGVMGNFITLTVAMVSRVHTYVKTHQFVHFKFVNYASVKLRKRGRKEGREGREGKKKEKKRERRKEERKKSKPKSSEIFLTY